MRPLFPELESAPEMWLSERVDGSMKEIPQREQFLRALAIDAKKMPLLKQIHGARILSVNGATEAEEEGDGLINAGDTVLGVRVADCLPVFAWSQSRRWRALLHAGWRGIAAGIVQKLLEWMPVADDLQLAIGPGIGPCCFEVGEEVRQVFLHESAFFHLREACLYLDLRAVVAGQFRAAGIAQQRIHIDATCTRCETALWSHRREESGSMLAIMMDWNDKHDQDG